MLCGRSDRADWFMPGRGPVPDSQLVFSADLAASIGLEEAVLIQQLQGLYRHLPATPREGLAWLHVSHAYLRQLLPFFREADLHRLTGSLEARGLLRVDRRSAAGDSLLFALTGESASSDPPAPSATVTAMMTPAVATTMARATAAPAASEPAAAGKPAQPRPARAEGEPLPRDFTPSEDMLELLGRFHHVPRDFALQQVEDFMLYWRERGSAGHAWQNKFKKHVLFQWARYQQGRGESGEHTNQRGAGNSDRTRNRSLEQDLTDTSWAE